MKRSLCSGHLHDTDDGHTTKLAECVTLATRQQCAHPAMMVEISDGDGGDRRGDMVQEDNDSHRDVDGGGPKVDDSSAVAAADGGEEEEEVLTKDGSSIGSSQLINGPADGGGSPGAMQHDLPSHTPDDLSVNGGPSNDGSYFILDEGGQHVLDDQGSPARARKWQPVNVKQRERYIRLHQATKGPRATSRWLPSVLVSPDHLRVPRVRATRVNSTIKGVRLSGTSSPFEHVGFAQQHQFPPGGIIERSSIGGCNNDDDEGRLGEERRREIEIAKKRRRFLVEERRRTRPKQLDGFMLMDACGCDLPDEGRRADVSGRGLVSAVREDMAFFVRLQAVDAGDNSLPFDTFVDLPRLDELRLPCNSIRDIDVPNLQGQHKLGRVGGGNNVIYMELRRLDLSYNSLSADALSSLVRLPNLTDLDLTCNGLTDLPQAMGLFPRLQKLSLERNQLESDAVFDVLSKLPALRELNLAFNYFTGVSLKPETAECAFPLLEGLDLGFNYIGSESDVVVVALLGRLQRIILYGNPLTGPTGEDPLGLCVENLIAESDRIRGDYASYPIEVITELPRIKQTRVGGGGGGGGGGGRRRRPYGDTGITMVDEGYLPSASAFREAGNRSLFRFERRSNYGENDDDDHADAIVEATLRSAKERNNRAASAARNSAAAAAAAAEKDLTFLTGIERQEREYDAGADAAAAAGEAGDGFGTAVAADVGRVLGQQTGGAGGMSTRLLRGPVDPMVRGDPVKLQMALAALRYTLKHPVTSSMDIQRNRQQQQQGGPASGNNKDDRDSGVGRKTAASRARQLPRRPFRLLKPPHEPGFCVALLDGPAKGDGAAGRLGRVDKVLTSMGAGMDAMVLEKRARENENGGLQGRPGLSSIIHTVNAVLDENEY